MCALLWKLSHYNWISIWIGTASRLVPKRTFQDMSTQKLPHFQNCSWTSNCATMGRKRKCLQKLLTFLSLALKWDGLWNSEKNTCQKRGNMELSKILKGKRILLPLIGIMCSINLIGLNSTAEYIMDIRKGRKKKKENPKTPNKAAGFWLNTQLVQTRMSFSLALP